MTDRNSPIDLSMELHALAAFQRIEAEAAALRPEEVVAVNLDVGSAVTTALAAVSKIRAQRELVVATLPAFNAALFDKIEDYALATGHANAVYKVTTAAPDDLNAAMAEGVATCARLEADLHPMIERGVLEAKALDDLSRNRGFQNVANDLEILVVAFRKIWPQVQGKCFVDLAELERAELLIARIRRLSGIRGQTPANDPKAMDTRDRVFTLFSRAYDELRRAIAFVRWSQGDGDVIAPTIYGTRNRKATTDTKPAAPPVEPVAPAPGGSPFVS